jgi:hypothetical protein
MYTDGLSKHGCIIHGIKTQQQAACLLLLILHNFNKYSLDVGKKITAKPQEFTIS